MMLDIIACVVLVGCFVRACILKTKYIKTVGVCLECHTRDRALSWFAKYEYEMKEYGKTVIYQNKGNSCFGHIVGKKYRVLVNKKDHDKVVAYNEYITMWVLGIIIIICLLIELNVWKYFF